MIEIQLTQGQVAIVDDEDAGLAELKWCASYHNRRDRWDGARRKNCNRTEYMHRVILERKLGRPISVGMQCDHVDTNVFNNRRSNLREATNAQNGRNRGAVRRSSSKNCGVSWAKRPHKWEAYIHLNGKRKRLGYFTNEIEAAKAYDKAALKLHGAFARLNFPEGAAAQ